MGSFLLCLFFVFFFFKQKTAYEMRISDWSSDVCSSDPRGMLRDEPRQCMDARHDLAKRQAAVTRDQRSLVLEGCGGLGHQIDHTTDACSGLRVARMHGPQRGCARGRAVCLFSPACLPDRQSGVLGKGWSVRVECGGGRVS